VTFDNDRCPPVSSDLAVDLLDFFDLGLLCSVLVVIGSLEHLVEFDIQPIVDTIEGVPENLLLLVDNELHHLFPFLVAWVFR